MTAHEMFQQLVQQLYSSHLHFHLTETPFSAQILVRKKFLKDGTSSTALNFQNEEIGHLNNKIAELQKQVKDSSDIINNLEKKLGQAEAQALKVYEENKTKMEALKSSIKNSDLLAKNVKKNLEAEQKVAKENEKLIQNLEHKCENLVKNNKNIQTELKKVKNENKKLSKNKNDLVQTKQNHEEKDSNQNVPPSKISQLSSSSPIPAASSLLLSPRRKVSTPPYTPSPTSLATGSSTSCGTPPRPSLSTAPPTLHQHLDLQLQLSVKLILRVKTTTKQLRRNQHQLHPLPLVHLLPNPHCHQVISQHQSVHTFLSALLANLGHHPLTSVLS